MIIGLVIPVDDATVILGVMISPLFFHASFASPAVKRYPFNLS
jgi:hypothetical protein